MKDKLLVLALEDVVFDPEQPRMEIDPIPLGELAESIRLQGLLQPISVRERDGQMVLISGERRTRAHMLLRDEARKVGDEEAALKFSTIAAVLRSNQSATALFEAQIAENQKRAGFTDLERALSFVHLVNLRCAMNEQAIGVALRRLEDGKTLERDPGFAIGEALKCFGMKPSSVRKNLLPLLVMPEELKVAVRQGQIGSAAALLLRGVGDAGQRLTWLEEVKTGALTLQVLEQRVRGLNSNNVPNKETSRWKVLGQNLLGVDRKLQGVKSELRPELEHELGELERLAGVVFAKLAG